MDWRYNTIWFDELAPDSVAAIDFNKPTAAPEPAQYLIARSFKKENFSDFPAGRSLTYLSLTLGNLRNFIGLRRFKSLKRLELSHCLKLNSDMGLLEGAESIEWLHINQSKKFSIGDEILGLTNLKVLCLNDCGKLPNLQFLSALPRLVDFRFVNTDVTDGDLSPLLNHPSLCSVGFLDKRHFNLKASHVKRTLESIRPCSKVLAHKGKYETYRYIAVGA